MDFLVTHVTHVVVFPVDKFCLQGSGHNSPLSVTLNQSPSGALLTLPFHMSSKRQSFCYLIHVSREGHFAKAGVVLPLVICSVSFFRSDASIVSPVSDRSLEFDVSMLSLYVVDLTY